MTADTNLHSQLASIMEVLANAAVAEICQLVDDGFADLRLEVSRCRRENLALKSRLRLMEVRAGPRAHREPVPPLHITCTRTDHHFGGKHDAAALKCISQEKNLDQQSKMAEPAYQEVTVRAEPADQEVTVRAEPADQEVTVRAEPADQEVTVRAEPADQEVMMRAEPVDQEVMMRAEPTDQEVMVRAELAYQEVTVRVEPVELETLAVKEEENQTNCSLLQEYGMATCCSGAARSLSVAETECSPGCSEQQDVCRLKEGAEQAASVGLYNLRSTPAESLCAEDTVLSELNSGEKCADWTAAVKLETQRSWSQAFCTHGPPVCVSSECLTSADAKSLLAGSEAARMDPDRLDSCSFDDLFSSPEVALSLAAPHKRSSLKDEPLQPSSFPFRAGGASECSSAERSFSCQQCGRLFSAPRDLLVHQRSHAGERIYHCHLCRKPFLHPHQLKTHQRVHTGEKPFSCSQCGKRFSQSSHINRHMSVHTGEKRYSCGLCGKRFSQACSLKVHQAVHTGERPYSCTKCGKSFSVLGNLVRHQSIHIGK